MAAVDVIDTGWVAPPTPIGGLDHLGVQAPCIALYGQLLPGITNVTDRARYYAFHPWVVWNFEKRYSTHTKDAFARVLRRAECLFALVGAYHEQLLEQDERLHGQGMVGRDKLVDAARTIHAGTSVDIDDYAAFDGAKRYFKNRRGGLGQYYFGTLRDLRILDYPSNNPLNPPGYDSKRGAALAQAFDAGVDGNRFFKVLEEGTVGKRQLDALLTFCPCTLCKNSAEHELLLDLFLSRTEDYQGEGSEQRRLSLGLLLHLVRCTTGAPPELDLEGILRAACYTKHLPNGEVWEIPTALESTRRGWATYQRNELLSVATQGLFWATLHAIDLTHGGQITSASDAGPITAALVTKALEGEISTGSVADTLDSFRRDLPNLENWAHEQHELRRAWGIVRDVSANPDRDDVVRIAGESIRILLSLMARGSGGYPYSDFQVDPSYFAPEEIHLVSFQHHAERWGAVSLGEWASELGTRWGVNRHLQVALRKLRTEGKDTFRIRPLEGALRVIEVPFPVFTSPRIGRAQQIILDLGLVELNEENWWQISPLGRSQLEAYDG